MRNRNTISVGSMAALALLQTGCDDEHPGQGNANLERSGIEAHFVAEGSLETECGDAEGIRLQVEDPNGDEQVCIQGWADVGGYRVADCFIVGTPGLWHILALDTVDGGDQPLTCCESEIQETATVHSSETTEIGGQVHCSTTAEGGLDIYAVLTTRPVIEDLDILPSKFGVTCVGIELVATASGEGELDYSWTVTQAPEGATWELTGEGNTAVFITDTVGDYEVRLLVTSEAGQTAHLDFPLHIIEASDAVCEFDDDDEDTGADDEPDKDLCNQGVGNGPEACDPGNSNQGDPSRSNDENGGIPGAPGRQGGNGK